MKQCLPPITIDFPTWVTQKQYRTCQMRLGMQSPLSRWAKISHCCHDTPRAPWICSECLVCTGQPVSVNKNQLAVLELLKSMKKSIIDGCQSLKVPKGPPWLSCSSQAQWFLATGLYIPLPQLLPSNQNNCNTLVSTTMNGRSRSRSNSHSSSLVRCGCQCQPILINS